MTILKTAAGETNFPLDRVYQALVTQKMDSAIHRMRDEFTIQRSV